MARLLIVNSIPSPNNDVLFRLLARQPGLELLVAYSAWQEPHRLWRLSANKDYPYVVMRGHTFGERTHFNPGVGGMIRRFAPDVAILSGSYTMPTMHLAARALRGQRVPWVYWGEALSQDPLRAPQRWVRDALRRTIRSAYGVLAIGSRARDSYARIGVPHRRIADFRYYAENAHFELPDDTRASARHALRSSLRLPEDATVFLYCGQLIERKRVDTLLHALASLRRGKARVMAVVAGEGSDRPQLEALAERLGVQNDVRFVGFVDYPELPRYFAAVDALVLPSRQEGWGLVVPEAMAAGLPVLASDQVNSAVDLVREAETGWLFPVGDSGMLSRQMTALHVHGDRATLAENARAVARREAPEPAAGRLVSLVEAIRTGHDLHDVWNAGVQQRAAPAARRG